LQAVKTVVTPLNCAFSNCADHAHLLDKAAASTRPQAPRDYRLRFVFLHGLGGA